MKYDDDQYTNTWLDKLDAILAGDNTPTDNELLQIASHLAPALSPLREMDAAAERHRRRLLTRLHTSHTRAARKTSSRLARLSLLVAVLLIFILVLRLISAAGLTALSDNVTQLWHTSTSLNQIKGLSVASLSPPHAGLKPLPLLPTSLPPDTQSSAYGVITDHSNPDVLTTFVADYHIAGQEVLLYEQPSDTPFLSPTAKAVLIGNIEGQLFQDSAGTSALQWYQHGMQCQLTSKLAANRLVTLAGIFQPIKNWDLIL